MKKIVLLGASGSIGTQTIDVVKHHDDEFMIVAVSIGHNVKKLEELLVDLPHLKAICVANHEDMLYFQDKYPNYEYYDGDEGLKALASLDDYDIFVNAVVGFRGLVPLLCAIEHDKVIALANKESLVCGGELVKKALKEHPVPIYPIDSEHSAIFQCLACGKKNEVDKLIVTASGGSFRDYSREDLANVSVKQALNHPNWNMGGRITIDSATMMNKAFEVIEAHYLFDIPFEKIDVLIHRESIIHSMVQYIDHSIIAQLGSADMRIPIQVALGYPNRYDMPQSEPLDFLSIGSLHFEKASFERYPLLSLAYEVGAKKGNLGTIINGADEEAVSLFLKEKISFLDIETSIFEAIKNVPFISDPSLDDIVESDRLARVFVRSLWKGE